MVRSFHTLRQDIIGSWQKLLAELAQVSAKTRRRARGKVREWVLTSRLGGRRGYLQSLRGLGLVTQVQALEPRLLMTTYIWDNSLGNGNWNDAQNWTQNAGYPQAADDIAQFTDSGATTVHLPGTVSIASVMVDASQSYTFDNGTLGGSTTLTKNGAGTLTLNGASNYSGATTIIGGRLEVSAVASFRSTTDIASTGTLDMVVTSGTATVSTTYSITGTGNLIKSGDGTWVLGAAGSHVNLAMTGGLIDIQHGTIRNDYISHEWDSNSASLNIASEATLDIYADNIKVNALSGGGTIQDGYSYGTQTLTVGTNDGSATFSGSISNTVGHIALVKIGSGTQTLSGVNSYDGGTTISAGTLQLGSSNSNGVVVGNIINNSSLVFANPYNQTYAGTISGNGTFTKTGDGTLTLTGLNTYSGATTVNAGVLKLGDGSGGIGTVTGTSGATTVHGGRLVVTSAIAYRSNTILDSAGTLEISVPNGTVTVSTDYTISGTGTLIKSGGGTWVLGASIARVSLAMTGGLFDIQGGKIQNNWLRGEWNNNHASLNIADQAVLDLYGENVVVNALSGLGTVQDGYSYGTQTLMVGINDGSGTFSGSIQNPIGHIALVKIGSGIQTLSGVNSYDGGTIISAGTLQLGDVTGNGTMVGNIVNNSALIIANPSDQTYAGTISGNGTFTKSGAGTLTLSGLSTYSGTTTVNAGVLKLGDGSGGIGTVTGTSGATTVHNGRMVVNSAIAYRSNTSIDAAGALEMNVPSGTVTVSSGYSITGTGTLVKSGVGTWILGAIGSHVNLAMTAGLIDIQEGTIKNDYISHEWDNNGASLNIADGATLDIYAEDVKVKALSGGGTILNAYANGPRTLTVGVGNGSGAFSGRILTAAGDIALVKTGTGTQILSGDNNYGGGTTINAGALQLGDVTGNGTVIGNIVNNSALIIANPDGQTYAEVINGSGTFTKAGNGTLTLTGLNTYNGTTTVNAGVLKLGDGSGGIGTVTGTSGATTVHGGRLVVTSAIVYRSNTTLDSAGILEISVPNGTVTVSSSYSISGNGTLIKSGAGSWVLGAISSHITLAMSGGLIDIQDGMIKNDFVSHEWDGNHASLNIEGSGVLDLFADDVKVNALSGSGTIRNSFAPSGVRTLTVGVNGGSDTFSGAIEGIGGDIALVKTGTGTQILSGTNSYHGPTTVNEGILNLTNTTGIAPLVIAQQGTYTRIVDLSAGNYTLTFTAAQRSSSDHQNFQVLLDGTVLGTYQPSGTTATAYTRTLTQSSGNHTLTFRGLDTVGGANAVNLSGPGLVSSPWTAATIGGAAGAENLDGNGQFTINGSGTIAPSSLPWYYVGTATDSFNTIYQSLGTYQQIVGAVTSQQDTNAIAKSGLMIRASTADNVAFAGIFVSPDWGVLMLGRTATGVNAECVGYNSSYNLPYAQDSQVWLKLTKQTRSTDLLITGYASLDGGGTWAVIGEVTLGLDILGTSAIIGVASDSAASGIASASTISNVSVSALITGATVVPEAPYNIMAEAYSGSDGRLVWQPLRNTDGVTITIYRSTDGGMTFSNEVTIPGTADTYLPADLLPNTTYTYRLQATSSGGTSPLSPAITLTTGTKLTRGYYQTSTGDSHIESGTPDSTMDITSSKVPVFADSWEQAFFLKNSGTATYPPVNGTYTLGGFQPVVSDPGTLANAPLASLAANNQTTATDPTTNRPRVGFYGDSFGYLMDALKVWVNFGAGTLLVRADQKDAFADVLSYFLLHFCEICPTCCTPVATTEPVGYADGGPQFTATDLSSNGFAGAWSITRNWTTMTQFVPDNSFGYGWTNNNQTYLQNMDNTPAAPNILLVNTAYSQTLFTTTGTGGYVSAAVSKDTFVHNSDHTYSWLDTSTRATSVFYDFSTSVVANLQGKLKEYHDANGNTISLSYNGLGQLTTVTQTDAFANVEEFHYEYFGSGANAGQVSYITQSLMRTAESTATVFRKAVYSYYTGTYTGADAYGNQGDLQSVKIEDGVGNVINETHYRYYTQTEIDSGSAGFVGALKYVVLPDNFAKLAAVVGDPLAAADNRVADYADNYFEYDEQGRVTTERAATAGASSTGGEGTSTLEYKQNPNFPSSGAANFNTWWMRSTETLPDGTQHLVYTNVNKDALLTITVDNANTIVSMLAYQYDSFGRKITTINPSAMNVGYYDLGTLSYETANDVGITEGGAHNTIGLVNTRTFYPADSTGAGSAPGYLEADYIKQGITGTSVKQDFYTYSADTDANGNTIYNPATYTVYRSTDGSGAETTTFSYVYSNTHQLLEMESSAPLVSGDQHGPDSADVTAVYYDSYGRPIWTKDAEEHINYFAYDTATGAVVTMIQDLDYNKLSETLQQLFDNGPHALASEWSQPFDGLHLVTSYEVDSFGRTIKETSPNNNVTYTVYDDANHAVFILPGAINGTGTLTTTGPITMVRARIPYTYQSGTLAGTYDESVTFSGTVTITDGKIDSSNFTFIHGNDATSGEFNVLNLFGNGTSSPQFVIQLLSRTLYNISGQAIERDAYANINNANYLGTNPNTPYSGSPINPSDGTGSYAATHYGYDLNGRWYQTTNANGTITDTVYDTLSRVTSTWVGTNDTTIDGLPFIGLNGGTGDNMTEVFAYAYDGGNVGDSDLTQSTQFVDSNSAHDRITDYLYDWRNRLVASRQADGIGYSITYRNLDNLGEATSTFAFEGSAIALSDFPTDGITIITDGGGHSVASVDPSALRRYSTAAYDDQGRVYSTATYSVEPDTGYLTVNPVTSTITPLTSAVWYDHRGNVIETQTSGSAATKIKYDGAGRMTVTYTTDGGAVNNSGAPLMSWDAAGDVSNDVVLEQVEYLYDADSNIIETIDRQRFHDETGTDALGDPSSATQPKARVYYTLAYYDAANRLTASVNVGTNGGVLTDFNDGLDLSTDDNTDGTPDILQNGIPGSYNPDTVLVTSYTYNVAGWVNTVTDPRGIVSKTFYDNLGRTLYSVAAWAGVYDPTQGELPSSGSQNQTTKYTYDGDGHILTMTAVMPSTQNSQTTQYTYGVSPVDGSKISSNDLLRLVAYPDKDTGEASNDDSARNHFTYNAAGQVLTKTDQNGTKHTYTYDVLGRQTKDEIAVAEGNPHLVDQGVVRIETSYDSQGNVYQITSYNAATEYNIVNRIQREYNGLGQLIREYQSTSGPVNGTTPQVRYAYSSPDTGSRIVSMTYPNGRILHYGYDGSALDTAIGRLSYLADDDGGDVGQPLEEYTYLGLSTVVQLAHPEVGTKLTYTSSDSHANYDGGDPYTGLDRFGRVIDQNTITVSTGVSTDRFQYGYDRNGNVLYKNNIVNLADSELYHANSANSGDDNSAYDPLNRLTGFIRGELSASGNNGGSLDKVLTANRSQSWNLDALGNMNTITTDTSTETRTYNSQNEITSLGTDAYDNNGNTIKDDQGHHLVYDAWNRLVRVLNADNTTVRASYTYDGMRRRVTETYPATSTTNNLYYSSQWQVLEERQNGTDNSNVSQQYVWSPTYVDAMVLRDSFSSGVFTQRLYVQYDANYNVTALIDGTPLSENLGQPVERYIYDSYGKVTVLDAGTCSQKGGGTVAASGFGWRYLHQGGRFDAATGLYNFRNRDYSPTLQRWMQQEPYGAAYIDGMNLYQSYVANPINRLDPHGTDEQSATGKAITKEAIKQSIEYLQSQPGEVGRLGQLAGNTNNVIQDANRIQKVAGALYDLGTAIGTNDPEERKAALNRAAKYVGEEEVKSIMKSLAVKLGEDIGLGAGAGAIYAAVLIDAMKTGDAIGQKAANMLDDAFVQNVYTNAQNNPQLVRGSMIYQQGSGRFGLYVFVDNNGQIWVRRPVVHSGLYILVWGMWHCPDFEWVHP